MIVNGHRVFTIRSSSGTASASFAPSYGALGTSLVLSDHGQPREMLYQRPDFWTTKRDAGGLPFLFPVCGRHILNGQAGAYRMNGITYDMPLHGFSLRKQWTVNEVSANRLQMSLSDDAQTRENYPYEFTVTLDYLVTDTSLICRHGYENRSSKPMPFYSGFHPYFAVDELDSGEWEIEASINRIGQYDDTFARIQNWEPGTSVVEPVVASKNQRVAEIDSAKPVLLKRNGVTQVEMQVSAETDHVRMSYLQLYRSNDDPFICLEPWMGLPNGLNEPERIPGIAPGATVWATFTISAGGSSM